MSLLKRLRIANGYTQTSLAKRIKVVPSTVSLWESGETFPHPDKVKDLAKLLGVSPFDLTKYISPDPQPFAQEGGAA